MYQQKSLKKCIQKIYIKSPNKSGKYPKSQINLKIVLNHDFFPQTRALQSTPFNGTYFYLEVELLSIRNNNITTI